MEVALCDEGRVFEVDAVLLASSRLFAAIAARPESLTGADVEDEMDGKL